MGGNPPPPFAENSAKIINLIFEPFPKFLLDFGGYFYWDTRWGAGRDRVKVMMLYA